MIVSHRFLSATFVFYTCPQFLFLSSILGFFEWSALLHLWSSVKLGQISCGQNSLKLKCHVLHCLYINCEMLTVRSCYLLKSVFRTHGEHSSSMRFHGSRKQMAQMCASLLMRNWPREKRDAAEDMIVTELCCEIYRTEDEDKRRRRSV